MVRKTVSICLITMLALSIFIGCGVVGYNAKLYDMANDWIKKEFADENVVTVAGFIGVEYPDPSERVFIVRNQEDYDKIFIADIPELNVDFSKQMIIVYTSGSEHRLQNKITKTELKNDKLTITYKRSVPHKNANYVCQPYQRWFVVILDSLSVTEVDFVEK